MKLRQLMKILYLHQHFSPPNGTGNNRSLELAQNWVKAGHEVIIVCGSGNFENRIPFFQLYKRHQFDGLKVIQLNVNYSHFASFSARILSFFHFVAIVLCLSLKLRKTDIVYASSTPLTIGLLGIWFKKWFRKPFVFETVDLWPDVPIGMQILKNKWLIKSCLKLEKWIYKEAQTIVCLSEGMQKAIEKKGVTQSKIVVSQNGTNCSTFRPRENKAKAKQELGYSEYDFIVLYAGTIGLANGLEYWVDVAKNIKLINIHFIFLGNGNKKNEVVQYVKNQGTTNISFVEAVPKTEVKKYVDAADLGIVSFASYPILETNSANKFYDYLASGLPVLINYEGWQKYYLERFHCGFASRNKAELVNCILKLYEDETTRNTLSINARKLAEIHFDREKIAEALLDVLYDAKLKKHPKFAGSNKLETTS